ncbi:MAG TPA: hypothetical protein VFT79_03665 [Solirubrobacterales bacterium]|nr:hypothetical protein [Solirubrobacterales bacterium]
MRSTKSDRSKPANAQAEDPRALLCTGQSYLERLGVLYMEKIRVHIVTELYMREMTPAQFFATVGGTSYPAVRRHFVKLVETGWLRQVRPASGGPGKPGMLHRATELPLIDNETFERFPVSIRDTFTVQLLEEMGCRLGEAMSAGTAQSRNGGLGVFKVAELDESGWCMALAAVEHCFKVLSQIQTDAKLRIDHGYGRPLSMIVNLAAFEMPTAKAPGSITGELPLVDGSALIRHHWPERIGKVFVDPLNLAIIDVLHGATLTSSQLHDYFGMRTPRKLRERCQFLAELGFVAILTGDPLGGSDSDARSHRFRATSPRTSKAAILRPIPPSAREGDLWQAFDQFASASVEALEGGTFNIRPDRHLTESQLLIDEIGRTQVVEALANCKASLEQAKRVTQRQQCGGNVSSFGLLVTGFNSPFREMRG